MPIPTAITDLSATAASNYPAGSDAPSVLDNVQREHAAYIRQLLNATQSQAYTAFTTGGTTTAYTLTPTPALTALATGQRFNVQFNAANTSATPTLAISGLTAKSLKVYNPAGAKADPAVGAFAANMIADVIYDGTDYLVLDQLPATGCAVYFESAAQTITQAGPLTIAHGLVRKPVKFEVILKCTTGDMSYSIGDELVVPVWYGSGVSFHGFALWVDATNLNIRFVNAATVYYIADKTTGNAGAIVNGSWKMYIRAWA